MYAAEGNVTLIKNGMSTESRKLFRFLGDVLGHATDVRTTGMRGIGSCANFLSQDMHFVGSRIPLHLHFIYNYLNII